VQTRGETDIVDVTGPVADCIRRSRLTAGTATVFCPGSTGGLTTIEFEPGLVKDIPLALEKVAPREGHYHHHETWHDDNGSAHVRAALVGPSITVPFVGGEMTLGTWQQIVFVDFDTRPRDRRLVVQILGDGSTER
jgi:secondary thiamine-phosphate synthase enzyme